MAKSIKVLIGGKEYSLVGDDEALVHHTANEVNLHLNDLKTKHSDLPQATLSILAALNISEEKYKETSGHTADKQYIINEIRKMSDYLEEMLQS